MQRKYGQNETKHIPSQGRSNVAQRRRRTGVVVKVVGSQVLILLLALVVLQTLQLGRRVQLRSCKDDDFLGNAQSKSSGRLQPAVRFGNSIAGNYTSANLKATDLQTWRLGGASSVRYDRFFRALNKIRAEDLLEDTNPLYQELHPTPRTHLSRIDIHPKVKYLGVLVDGGRHYFSIDWLKHLIMYLHRLRYNTIHFRLTDDQAFNVKLDSYPQLASPASASRESKTHIYTPDELRGLVEFANSYNITIIPEINVPGHAGAWGPDLVVQCPGFICDKGYGIPLNIEHPDLKSILKGVIGEIIDIFDNPPFLHLGGDETSMGKDCFAELGKEPFEYRRDFEPLLKEVLHEIGYPENQVIRWEETSQLHGASPENIFASNLTRAGLIEHYWHDKPGTKTNKAGEIVRDDPPQNPIFVSRGLYMDVDHEGGGYHLYNHSFNAFQLEKGPEYYPIGIIAGTFELNSDMWTQRNIATRLIAIAMGAAQIELSSAEDFANTFRGICLESLGLDPVICDLEGFLAVPLLTFSREWSKSWSVWKNQICEKLTEPTKVRQFINMDKHRKLALEYGTKHFWQTYRQPPRSISSVKLQVEGRTSSFSGDNLLSSTTKAGVLLDLSNSMQTMGRLVSILNSTASTLELDLVQLRLADNYGFAVDLEHMPIAGYSPFSTRSSPLINSKELALLVQMAHTMNVEVFPEISVTTNAGGWVGTGFLAKCPEFFCGAKTLGMAVGDIGRTEFIPVVYSVLRELRDIFSTSHYFSLGADERVASKECFEEDARYNSSAFADFESNLTLIMRDQLGISPQTIIRFENQEQVLYKDRTGDITQYRSTTPFSVPKVRAGKPFFVNMDLLASISTSDASSLSLFYDIYKNTRALMRLNPAGIFAEIRLLDSYSWDSYSVHLRLLAFRLGTLLRDTEYSFLEFKDQLIRACWKAEFSSDCNQAVNETQSLDTQIKYGVESKTYQTAVCTHYTNFRPSRKMKSN